MPRALPMMLVAMRFTSDRLSASRVKRLFMSFSARLRISFVLCSSARKVAEPPAAPPLSGEPAAPARPSLVLAAATASRFSRGTRWTSGGW